MFLSYFRSGKTNLSFFLFSFLAIFFQCMKAQQQHRWAAAEKNETIQKEKNEKTKKF